MSIYTKIYIYAVGILGIYINGIYHIIDMQTLMSTTSIHESIASIISNTTLNFSWILLYIWFLVKPIERKCILLISVASMVLAHSLSVIYGSHEFKIISSLPSMMIIIFFLFGFYLLNKTDTLLTKRNFV